MIFAGNGTTVLTGANDYTGKTAIVGGAVVETDAINGRLGQDPGTVVGDSLYLNDGTLRYTGSGEETISSTRGITLGGGGGVIEFTGGGRLVYLGNVVSEANPIAGYNAVDINGNPLVGDLTIRGEGTFQLGAFTATDFGAANYAGIRNTYAGLTTIGDGVTRTAVAIRGQVPDDTYVWPFGTHEGFDDGTLILNNSELRLQFQRSSNTSYDAQVRLLEWFTFGQTSTDETWLYQDTGRSVEIAGNVLVNGTLYIHSQNNGVDVGNASNTSIYFGVNSGYGGQLLGDSSSRVIKTGAGTLDLRESSSGFEGTLEVRRGNLYLYGYGDVAGVGEKLLLGDQTHDTLNLGDTRIRLVQRSSNNNTDITSEAEDLHLYQDIDVYGITGTTTSNKFIGAALYTVDSSATFHGDINILERSSTASAGLYVELSSGAPTLNEITGRVQRNYIFLNGDIIGSGSGETSFIDVRVDDGVTSGTNPLFGTIVLGGDNSRWKGELRIGGGNTAPDVGERTIVRLANDLGLGAANNVRMYYHSYLQLGGSTVTIGSLINGITGGNNMGAWDENATGTASSTMTIENASKADGHLTITENGGDTIWNALFRDGETPAYFDSSDAPDGALHITKDGNSRVVLNQLNTYTGTTTVAGGNLQVGQSGNGSRAVADNLGRTGTGATTVRSGGMLSGTGVVQGSALTTHVIESGGLLAPGDDGGSITGTLFVDGNLTIQAGGKVQLQISMAHSNGVDGMPEALASMDSDGYADALSSLIGDALLNGSIDSSYYDHLEISGTFSITSGSLVEVVDMGYLENYAAAGDVFNLIDWGSVNAAGFLAGGVRLGGELDYDLLLPALTGDLVWDTSLFASHGILVVTTVPEPGRWMLLAAALACGVLRRHRGRAPAC